MKRFLSILLIIAVVILLPSCGKTAERTGAGRQDVAALVTDAPTSTEAPGETTDAPDPENGGTISVVMVGDVLLHEPITESGLADGGTRNYDHLFANVKSAVEKADLALVNEEVILGGEEIGFSGYPRFNGPYEIADAEAAAGFDVILQATNHALDKGKDGLLNDLDYYHTHFPELSVTGIYDSKEARDTICVREVGGVKIAILNYTYSTNGQEIPDDMPWAIAMLDRDAVRIDFEKAREQADYIIVCPHWGTEYSHEVSGYQRGWAELFVELGADLILGAHPHVIEPVETMTATDGKIVPVFWSVGNFICSTAREGDGVADQMVGAMAHVTLEIAEDGSVTTATWEALPLVTQMAYGYKAPTTYFLSDYTDALASESKVTERDPAFSLEYVRELCREVLGDAWKE